MSHPEDIRAVHLDVDSHTPEKRLRDAIQALDCSDHIEVTQTNSARTIVVGPELALGHLYVTLDEHADEWADERQSREAEACDRLRDDLYDDLVNARSAVGLARLERGLPSAGDRDAVEATYGTYEQGEA